jgi:hypothetical protein
MRRRVPTQHTGTIGSPVAIARTKAPFLKSRSWPSRERVPSGKMTIELASLAGLIQDLDRALARVAVDGIMPSVSRTPPTIGWRQSSCLAAKRVAPGQVAEQRQDVEMALMVRRIDDRARVDDVLQPVQRHLDAEHRFQVARARLREAPGERAATRRPMDPDRDRGHPDEHPAEEIRRERDP